MSQSRNKTLTIPVSEKLHREIHRTAKQAGVPVRVFGRLVLEKTLEEMSAGKVKINTKITG